MSYEPFLTKEIKISSMIKQVTRMDTLFKGHFLIDPYQNCSFGCLYCDSCDENTIYIKYNATEILEKELEDLPRKRVIIGSVHDPYQPVEKKTKLSRCIIKQLLQQGFPIHILTKSTLVLRDKDLFLSKDHDVNITFSVISQNPHLVSTIEPETPSFHKRLTTMNLLSTMGIKTGIALIPMLPYIVDDEISEIIKHAAAHHAQYFLFQHLFLKGDQKTRFFSYIQKHHPSYFNAYQDLFKDSIYPNQLYQKTMNTEIKKICGRYHLPTQIPE